VILIPFQLCSEIRNFEASPHLIKHLLLFAGTYQRESLHRSVCNSSMFQSIHWANQWNGRLWSGESMKWRANEELYIIPLMSLCCITPFISSFWNDSLFLSHSVFFSFPVLLSCFSLWTLERLYSFYNQGQQCKVEKNNNNNNLCQSHNKSKSNHYIQYIQSNHYIQWQDILIFLVWIFLFKAILKMQFMHSGLNTPFLRRSRF